LGGGLKNPDCTAAVEEIKIKKIFFFFFFLRNNMDRTERDNNNVS
jgi:hypothetical protein